MATSAVADSFSSLMGGMNESLSPSLLPASQFAKGINIAIRGGSARTRPAFVLEAVTGMPTTGVFQGGARWSLPSGDFLVFVVAGVIYAMNVDTNVLSSFGVILNTSAQCYFQQADQYLVIQDGVTIPIVLYYTAGAPAQYVAGHTIPIGTIMQYGHSRLHLVANTPGKGYFTSGDVLIPTDPKTVLQFTETDYWAGGGAHGLPAEMGNIGGMALFRNSATGTGVGDMVVMARNGAAAFDLSVTRTQWGTTALGQVLFFDAGTESPQSVISINGDVFYRGLDGIRTIRYTTQWLGTYSGQLSSAPQSNEIGSYFKDEPRSYLPYVSAGAWDNYAFVTATGVDSRYFKAITVLDLFALNSLAQASAPAYAGIWTGLKVGQIVPALRGGERVCFVFAEGPKLYRVDPAVYQDGSNDSKIEAQLITRGMSFGDGVFVKQFRFIDLWFSDVRVDTAVSVYIRPVGQQKWQQVSTTRTIEAPADGSPGYIRRVRFALDSFNSTCNTSSGEPLYVGTEFQVAIKWTGYLAIDRAVLAAERMQEPPPLSCTSSTVAMPTGASAGVTLSDFSYEIGGA